MQTVWYKLNISNFTINFVIFLRINNLLFYFFFLQDCYFSLQSMVQEQMYMDQMMSQSLSLQKSLTATADDYLDYLLKNTWTVHEERKWWVINFHCDCDKMANCQWKSHEIDSLTHIHTLKTLINFTAGRCIDILVHAYIHTHT